MNDEDSEEMNDEAISAICLDLGAEVIHNILEAQTTKKIQEKLKGFRMRKNLMNKVYVKKQI